MNYKLAEKTRWLGLGFTLILVLALSVSLVTAAGQDKYKRASKWYKWPKVTPAGQYIWPKNEPNFPKISKEEALQWAKSKWGPLSKYEKAAVDWVFKELQPSALTVKEQIKEMMWFAHASKPLRGVSIKSVAETIKTHKWESEVLTKAFEDITGIKVTHNIIDEGDLIEKLQTQLATGRKIYDVWVNDADLIGMHLRLQDLVVLSDYMKGEGKDFTDPYLDLDDFLNLEFGQDYEGNQHQIPDQQFANLYWFRYDWFTDPQLKKRFKKRYGYELGVPVNWAAYEDIAEFFTKYVDCEDVPHSPPNCKEIYGHMDYGKKGPSLGWRFTDAWLSIAGVGDKGIPNGLPVDEWGIRVKDKIPVGSMVARGGALNGPAAYYALRKYIEWLHKYAPPYAASMRWSEAGPVPSRGTIAQRPFQYITFLSAEPFTAPESPVTDENGYPYWRVAPTPHGRYWEEGMKIGYQDAGSWTIPKLTKGDKRKASWLWAQFCDSKTVTMRKFMVGKTPIRKSTVFSKYWEKHEGELGGLIRFYKSPIEYKWTDTGVNVPHYPLLAEQWWKYIGQAVVGKMTPKEAMDALAKKQDELMGKLQLPKYSPKLNPLKSREYWLNQPGAPKPKRPPEEPKTVPYDQLIKMWKKE